MLARSQCALAEKVSAVNLFANVRSEAPRSSPRAVSIFSCYQMRRKFPHSLLLLKHLLHDVEQKRRKHEKIDSMSSTHCGKDEFCCAIYEPLLQFPKGAREYSDPAPNAVDFPLRFIQLPRSIYLNTPASSGASLLPAVSYNVAEDCFEI